MILSINGAILTPHVIMGFVECLRFSRTNAFDLITNYIFQILSG